MEPTAVEPTVLEPIAQAAVLFADVSGSTKLYDTAGDAVAFKAISECVALLAQLTAAAGGRVVKTIGDEVMAVFPTADAAAIAAKQMQIGVSHLSEVAGTRMAIRIGFNFGQIVEKDGDVFGDAVNIAARLASQAQKDQAITSRETVDALSPSLKASCRQLYSIQLKGKETEVDLCELVWQETEEVTALVSMPPAPRVKKAAIRLRVRYGGQEIVLGPARASLGLGRDKSAELVINSDKASRDHCRLERRMDKFVIADHSANGTFVTIEGDKEVMLAREEFALRGHGWITCGQRKAEAAEVVEFFCEE